MRLFVITLNQLKLTVTSLVLRSISIMPQIKANRSELRKHFRTLRNNLTQLEQTRAAKLLLESLKRLDLNVTTVALFLANDGEINPAVVIDWFWQTQISVVLPVLDPVNSGHLVFQKYTKNTILPKNKYGIPEPAYASAAIVPLEQIDIVFMPLVAFDLSGNRLGMGGGYYDRTLETNNNRAERPILIGLAHDCQQAESLPEASWDIPLDLILTPSQKLITKHGEKLSNLPL